MCSEPGAERSEGSDGRAGSMHVVDHDRTGSGPDGHPRVRTFHARNGRVNEAMRTALNTLAPRFEPAARRRPGVAAVLEVGAGHGDAAIAFARAHPDVDVIAAEVHSPGVAHLLQALAADDPGNVSVAGDALELLDHGIASGELAGVHVFFPDPWPKARHHKRRFVRPDVLDLLADRMASGAELAIATDVDDYADWAQHHLDGHQGFVGGAGARPDWRPVAGYEDKALAAGRRITELRYRRR